jgi:class 3 adenylate cyclase/tetratricopeptide (TPR) repeat protein
MKCPKCQIEILEGAKFCSECGSKLETTCSACGKINPLSGKFCIECRHSLIVPTKPAPKELSFDEKLAKIQRYLPKDLTQKILAQRDKIEGERKQVTVMFCDMEGFTSLTEKLGSEQMFSIMDEVYEILIHKVHDYEGTVNEITGDGIMALFGAPIALEDAPQRAIRSALAIHREINKFSEQLKSEKRIPSIKMRIGIHTGPVIVGTLGNDLRVEFKAVGDTVNLASRMEGLAESGTTFVTEDTFKLTEGFFRFEALGEKKIRGKEEPVKVYQVIAPSTRRTKFDVSAERGLTPLVGRERELELLLDGFQRAKLGKGQAFSIISEAGCGKSRLLYEFRKTVANEDVNFLEGKCLSYGRGVAYHPVIDILKSNFDIQEGEGDQEIREKVKTGLKLIGADEASTLPYLLELLSVKDSGIDQISMSPEAKKDRINEAIKRIVLKGSEIRPLIIAFEDLHWLDKSSEDVVRSHLESIPGSRVLLIFTYRPEFVHTWGAKSYHNQLTLHRLSNRESLEMATHILGTKEIEKTLEELILEKTEGVPFFIEEFIKSLKDLKIIERKESAYQLSKDIQKLAIPSTIQDVIMARVDSLPEGAKEVLQTGSVIEREFSYPLINRVTGLPEKELLSHLSILKDSELLYERGIYPQSNYIFKHAMTREVVYDTILVKRKKRLHEEIGNAIEDLYKDNLGEHYEVLAEHYFRAENYAKSADYSSLAARKSEKTFSFPDAISYAEKRVSCLEKLPHTSELDRIIVDARTALGLYYVQMLYHDKAKGAVEPILRLAEEIAYDRRLAQIYTILGSYSYIVEENYDKAFQYFEKSLNLACQLGDTLSLWMAHFWLGLVFTIVCQFEKALHHLSEALEMDVKNNTLWGVSVLKSIIASWVHGFHGEIDQAFRTSKEALQMAEKSHDVFSKAYGYFSHGCSCLYMGFFSEAEGHLLQAMEACDKIHYFSLESMARRFLADTYFEMGRYESAEQLYLKAISLSKHGGFMPSFVNLYEIAMIRSRIKVGKEKVDLQLLYQQANQNKVRFNDGLIANYISEILMNMGREYLEEAEKWIARAVDFDSRNDTRWNLARDYRLYAELCMRKNMNAKAEETYRRAIEVFANCGAQGWVRRTEDQLEQLLGKESPG